MPNNDLEASTLPALNSGIRSLSERQWIPVYPVYARGDKREGQKIANGLPIDWICPCTQDGTRLMGNKSCPKCGRSPMDQARVLDAPQHAPHSQNSKNWRKFGRQY